MQNANFSMPMQYGMGQPFPQQPQQQFANPLQANQQMLMQYQAMNNKFPQGGFPQQPQVNGGINPQALQQMPQQMPQANNNMAFHQTPAQLQQQLAALSPQDRNALQAKQSMQQQQQLQHRMQQSFQQNASPDQQAQMRAMMQQAAGTGSMGPPRPPTAMQGVNANFPNGASANGFPITQMHNNGAFPQPQLQQSFMAPPQTPTPQQQQYMQAMQMARPPTVPPHLQHQQGSMSPAGAPGSPLVRAAKRKASDLAGKPDIGTPGPSSFAGSPPPQQPPRLVHPVPIAETPGSSGHNRPGMHASSFSGSLDSPVRPPTAASQISNTPAGLAPGLMGSMGASPIGSFPVPGPSTSPLAMRRPPGQMFPGSARGLSFPNLGPALPGGAMPSVTRMTKVPLAKSAALIPDLSESDITDVTHWLERERGYDDDLRRMKERMRGELKMIAARPANWYEKDAMEAQEELARDRMRRQRTKEKLGFIRPDEKRAIKERKFKLWRSKELLLPRVIRPADVKRSEVLVPIRLELDLDNHKLRETFVWNLHDPIVSTDAAAHSICDDFQLSQAHRPTIRKMIDDQLADYQQTYASVDEEKLEQGHLTEEDAEWWERWRKRLRTDKGAVRVIRKAPSPKKFRKGPLVIDDDDLSSPKKRNAVAMADDEAPMDVEKIGVPNLKLDILVGSMKLDDQFEWDVGNSNNSPERFAEVYCSELGLAAEFKTAVAHCIREQVNIYQKSLFIVGHPMDGSTIQDEDMRQAFLPPLEAASRSYDQAASYTPLLNHLSDGEIERNEKEREKELKRKRRQTRGRRGVALPDREPMKSHRTPATGFTEVDVPVSSVGIGGTGVTKRAAAVTASATIATMVASENLDHDLYPSPPMGRHYTQPAVNVQHADHSSKPVAPPKPSRRKGVMKGPAYPQAVLLPRAFATSDTPTTAVESAQRGNRPPNSSASLRQAGFFRPRDEFVAEGQHRNMIDGVWHCSNCGCPEDIAIGRRKGPNGVKSQCGQCGKYWHQHRKPRPVEYTTDRAHHERVLFEAQNKNKRGRAAVNVVEAPSAAPSPVPSANEGDASYRPQERAASPQSTISSISSKQSADLPLARSNPRPINGSTSQSRPVPVVEIPPPPPPAPVEPPPVVIAPAPLQKPAWLVEALRAMQSRFPDDQFDVIQKPRVSADQPPEDEWRIKCFDCPGKVYKLGPEESLTNFEVHLRNRNHRTRVTARVNRTTADV